MEQGFGRGLWNGREDGNAGFAEAGETFVGRGGEERNAERAAGRGAQGFGVPGADGAGERDNAGCAEGLRRAEDCAEIAGILQAGEDDEERGELIGTAEEMRPGPVRRFDERGDGLRIIRGEDGGENLFGNEEDFGFLWERELLEPGFEARREKEAIDCEAGAEGLLDEVGAFKGDEAGGRVRGFGEDAAELLEAVVLLALYNASRHLACEESSRGF